MLSFDFPGEIFYTYGVMVTLESRFQEGRPSAWTAQRREHYARSMVEGARSVVGGDDAFWERILEHIVDNTPREAVGRSVGMPGRPRAHRALAHAYVSPFNTVLETVGASLNSPEAAYISSLFFLMKIEETVEDMQTRVGELERGVRSFETEEITKIKLAERREEVKALSDIQRAMEVSIEAYGQNNSFLTTGIEKDLFFLQCIHFFMHPQDVRKN